MIHLRIISNPSNDAIRQKLRSQQFIYWVHFFTFQIPDWKASEDEIKVDDRNDAGNDEKDSP